MNKEDYNIIAPNNKVWDFHQWMENPNINDNDVSENPYPVMYVEGKPVWEGDKLLFTGDGIEEIRWWNCSNNQLSSKTSNDEEKISGVIHGLDDWKNMVEFWYSIRNNLFHGGKNPQDNRDLLFVEN